MFRYHLTIEQHTFKGTPFDNASNSRMRKWTVSGVIRHTDITGCYYLDPGTQHASQVCLDAVLARQFVLLWGARASGKSTRLLWLRTKLASMGYRAL
jgi:hypothetical protein